jgi:glycosyltransferase involved in cell wall biosynthesis
MSSQSSAINHQSSAEPMKPNRLAAPVRITEQVWPEGTVPLVSVFCITYNHVNFIRDAIEGFLMQETTFPVEIFIHDDASTDGTADIVREYAEKYPKLFWTVLQTENQWSKGNVNLYFAKWLQEQRGEFIALCEGDDSWIAKEKLQKQVEILEKDANVSLVFHNAWVKHEESRRDRFFNAGIDKETFSLGDVIERGWIATTASVVYRKSIEIIEDLMKISYGGDIVILVSAAKAGGLVFIDKVWSVYIIHEGGQAERFNKSRQQLHDVLQPNFIIFHYVLAWHLVSNQDIKSCWSKIHFLLTDMLEFAFPAFTDKNTPDFIGLKNNLLGKLKLELPSKNGKEVLSEQSEIVSAIDSALQGVVSNYYRSEISRLSARGNFYELLKRVKEAADKRALTLRELASYLIKGTLKASLPIKK